MHFPLRLKACVVVLRLTSVLGCLFVVSSLVRAAERVPLFDGKSLAGWEGNPGVWRVEDGAIVGGSLTGNPRNEFLTTTRAYRNFVLRLEYRLVGTESFVNGGVQFRSRRIAEPDHEMIGYQADIGAGHTGSLYDESRRKKFLAEASKPLIAQTEKPGEWNRYEIRCEGPRVVLQLNGRYLFEYTEREPGIEDQGLIGLQIHGGCKAEIAFRDITIEELSDSLVPQESEIMKRLVVEPVAAPRPDLTDSLSFALRPGEIIVTLGQGNLDRDARVGVIESALTATFATQRPRFRPMAWEGDTVYAQWREANFGSWNAQLTATGATLVLAQFGQMEAYDGPARIDEFTAAYARLLAQVPANVRIVVLSPLPLEKAVDAGPDVAALNQTLQLYRDAARRVADQRGASSSICSHL
ncbi:MAG TPA: family 16 glycoside hydrolase [Opitutus sp.]|nr:family 16 glycoside hydrolase [Opitutus sp.]